MPVLELEKRAIDLTPQSIDKAKRTAEMVISTGAPVRRQDFSGEYIEVLVLDGVDASRPNIPLLDSHRQDSLDRVLGRVTKISREASSLIATVQFAKTPAGKTAFKAVRNGDFASVSIGYSIQETEDTVDQQTGNLVRKVLSWVLHEVSLVPVPADAGAHIRSTYVPKAEKKGSAPAQTNLVQDNRSDAGAVIIARAGTNQEVRALAETFGLGVTFSDQHIDAGTPIEQVRIAAQEVVQKRTATTTPQASVTAVLEPSPEDAAKLMGEAVFARCQPTHKLSEQARSYANMTTLDMARSTLETRGVSTIGLSPADTITRALHSTSDFPLIFADTANRSLRQGYEAAPQTLKLLARQTTAKDFRKKTGIQLGEAPTLEKVGENGEYKHGTFAEASESYAIDTFGKIVGLSRKALVNDDLGGFVDLAGKFGLAAAEFEAQFLVDLLESGAGLGPAMSDGNTMFHADHANKSATGAVVSSASLGAARLAMRKQTGLSGRPINVTPQHVLVPPELEMTAEQILATIQPTKSADVNPFGGKLELLVEARLSDTQRWYVAAGPAFVDGLEYAYLQGEEGPQTETRAGFEVDGVEVKVRLDFGAAFMDWRGWYTNEGA